MTLTHLIFDLDNTLYPPSRGVVERVDVRITQFMVERLGLAPDDAASLRAHYRDVHGTTLNGLMLHHAIEPDDYLACVHAIAVEELLTADPELATMLASLRQRKVIFTNGSSVHAERVLACLGVRTHFSEVFSLEGVAYVPKPNEAAFRTVLDRLEVEPRACLCIDDRHDNLATARALGMRTVLVGSARPEPGAVDHAIDSIVELPAVLRSLGA